MSLPAAFFAEFDEPAGYVEFASIGPVSRRVRQSVYDLLGLISNPPGSTVEHVMPVLREAVETLARFMEVPVDRVTPVPSTSAGLFQVAFGLLRAGGHVVVPRHEFPANLYPWLRTAQSGGPDVRWVEPVDHRVTPEMIAEAVDARTRAVALSLVDFQTGFRVDLDGMREAAGDALLVVDAVQGLGAVHRGLGPADVMVAGGQKWMRAGWGSGVMAVSDRALDRLAPTLVGWRGVEDAMDTDVPAPHRLLESAARYQEGSLPVIGAIAIAAAAEIVEEAGIDAIAATILERVEALEEVLRSAGAVVMAPWRDRRERAGILCFRMPGETAADTRARLASSGVIASLRGEWVRLSPHATTSLDAIGMLADVL